jgi:UrcA family protein
MTVHSFPRIVGRSAILAASVFGLALTVQSAHAQAAYDNDNGVYQSGSDEVVIRAPRYHREYSTIGAPIEDVAISQVVPYDDLDLRTDWGASELRARVHQAAYQACDRMDVEYPVGAADSPPCVRTTFRDGMRQARDAIGAARGW